MRRTIRRRLLEMVFLALAAPFALGSTAALAGRPGAPHRDGGWLAFDGRSGPGLPTLTLVASDAQAVDLQAHLPGCQVEEVEAEGQPYSRLYGEGYGHPAASGLPDLPVLRRQVEIPFGAEVAVEIVAAPHQEYALAELGLRPLYPLQPPVAKLPGAQEGRPFVVDRGFYAHGSPYPGTPVALGQPYVVRGHRIQPVEVWPVTYDPSAGTLRLYGEVAFRLKLRGSDVARTQALAERYASPPFEARLAHQVLNYNQGRPAAPFALTAPAGYLIIAADAYADAMAPLVALRESQGLDVTMVRCSQVGCGSSVAIQAYVRNAYGTWPVPPSYVLLVGDTDTIPTWTGPAINTSTDLYYGTMDGPDDWHPDIGRGRFPVRSAAQATAMVDKYLAYARLTGQEPWLKKAAFAATCDNYAVAEGTHNEAIDNHTAPQGYWGQFPQDPQPGGDRLYCITDHATHGDLVNAFDDGRWAIVYSGHGSYDGWEMGFTPADVRSLTHSGMFPFVASHACLTGNFGQDEVFGETWVLQEDRGALAYWGSSTYSFWSEDDVLERAVFDSLFAPGIPQPDVAAMTDDGLDAVEAAYPARGRYYRETYNLLGDPAVKLFLEPDLPSFRLQVQPAQQGVCGSSSVTSTVVVESLQGYSRTVYLASGDLPAGVSATLEPASAPAPFSATWTLEATAGAVAGDYAIAITATDQVSWTHHASVDLQVATALPAAPTLFSPPDGSDSQPFRPAFRWGEAPPSRYRLQLDPDPRFDAPLVDLSGIASAPYTLSTPLPAGRCYWWRVQGDNACGTGDWAVPHRFATTALGPIFADTMESGSGRWAHTVHPDYGGDRWQISTAQSHSPTHAWFVPDDGAVTDSWLWNAAPVTVGDASTLTFWHRYSFEDNFDGAVLEISTDGGRTWKDLGAQVQSGGYDGTISAAWGNPLGGRAGWVGDRTQWTRVEVDLGGFAGRPVHIRWRLGCDSSYGDVGWYIDDVQITASLPPNPAPAVQRVRPSFAVAGRERPVWIEGRGFVPLPSLRLGETWLLSVTLVTSSTLTAVVPDNTPAGVYTLTLYNGDCQVATLPNALSVVEVNFHHHVYLPLIL